MAVVRWASRPDQRSVVGTLATIANIVKEEGIKPPALTIVGDVVSLRRQINWYEERTLFGKKLVVTRTRDQASDLVASLEENGANCLEFATISLQPPDSWEELDHALADPGKYQWIIFTSINAIDAFFNRLQHHGLDSRSLHNCRVAAVGRVTADCLLAHGIAADLLPDDFTGEGLAAALEAEGVAGQEILLPRALKAREVVPERLRAAGAVVTVAPVYQNVRPSGHDAELKAKLEAGEVDMVTFTSSSTVNNFVMMLGVADSAELAGLMQGVEIAAIGPITAKAVVKHGLKVDVQPETYTIPAMVEAIVNHYR